MTGPDANNEANNMANIAANSEAGSGSVSGWIEMIRLGNDEAVKPLLERYFQRLASFADRKLRSGIRTSDDGEDIASHALQSVVRRIALGSYPELSDRNNLWLLLMVAAQRRVIDGQRKEIRWQKNFAPVQTVTDLMQALNVDLEFQGERDDQSQAFELIEFWDHMLSKLSDQMHRDVAKRKLEGYSNREIAIQLQLTPKKVDRMVQAILERWRSIVDQTTDNGT